MSTVRGTGRWGAVVLLAALAGCGGAAEDREEVDPSPSTSSPTPTPTPTRTPSAAATPSAAPVRQPEAARALTAGLRRLVAGGAVDFRYQFLTGTTALIETAGRADLAGHTWNASTSFSDEVNAISDERAGRDEAGDYRLEVRAPGDRVFMQMVGWDEPFTGCWLELEPGAVPLGFVAMTPQLPAYVGVLGSLKPLGFRADRDDDSVIETTVSLRAAVQLLTAQAIQALGLPAEGPGGARVPATVYLEDGVVTDLRVDGRDVVEGVRAVGGAADSAGAAALDSLIMTIRYTPGPDGARSVTAPDDALVVTAADLDAGRGC